MQLNSGKIILTVTALAAAGALWYILWNNGAFLPGWILWEENNCFHAPDGCEITLADKTVCVVYGGKKIWNSPESLKVQQVLFCDIDRDNREELILLCWKRGRFGKSRPFWVEKDEAGWSQHIFVYEYEKEEIRPKWMSSYIGVDVVSISSHENKNGDRRVLLTDTEKNTSCWRWNSWGFEREAAEVSFAVFGDNMIHEPIYTYGLNHGGNFDFLYESVREKIAESDIAVIGQETPLVKDPALYGDYPRFGTPLQVGEAIAEAGFDVVACATNHALDRGAEGIHTTKEFFSSQNIVCLGIQTEEETERKPFEIIMRRGAKFALFSYTYGINGNPLPKECPFMVHLLENEQQIREDIEKAREEADFVIVFVHWGTENSGEIDDFQRKWTDVFLDSKVDVVVGSHPHALQPFEMLEGADGHRMLVYYSVGNFVSAQPEKFCEKGGMARFSVAPGPDGYEITAWDLLPLTILWQEGGGYTVKLSEE